MGRNKYKISIIGAGRVGTALSLALYKKKCVFLSIIDKDIKRAKALCDIIKAKNFSNHIHNIHNDTNLVLITTPDDELSNVAIKLAKIKTLDFKKLICIHTSGFHTTDILSVLKSKGTATISFHPIQTFSKIDNMKDLEKSLQNIYFGVETEKKNYRIANFLARSLNSKIIKITKIVKPIYHLACIFSSNYIITNLNTIEQLSRKINIKNTWKKAFRPLIENSIKSALSNSPLQALTGPVERGDLATINGHIEDLKKNVPDLLHLYCVLGIETAKIALKKKSISQNKFLKLKKLFEKNI